ncbi:hypothetical protein E0Z10_g9806 [Xylaria hypoxylon]|uniref:MYND-type domain-containing protein n=1 Tax=Xylaria hypoxylon TaxID=37992 RepID=A0A4Z0YMX2_9PEZI|nr:hypothetical protein E0Z10_g9806 [Xylaria hypoxylon]
MLNPPFINVISYFYPIGNTPAVSLTQTIPPGEPVDILLLGCGDVRNILFTSHVDARVMDITCCDYQKAVFARNILLLSLLIDGSEVDDNLLWSLYYHMNLDSKSLELLCCQAQKLHDLSTSMTTWQGSQYGSCLRFCDTGTLDDVRKMWAFYTIQRNGAEAKRFKARFDRIIQKENAKKNGGSVLTSYRATIPAQMYSISDLTTLHSYYWKHGTLELNAKMRAQAKYPNPMFLTLEDEATVHYGTDPLISFHLALANVPLEAQNPLSQALKGLSGREKIVATAKAEFRDWAASYRKQKEIITLRFVTADATNLAHTMQQCRSSGVTTAGLYRQQYDSRSLVLDGPDYVSGQAPLTFDVIDTSNLCDHLGSVVLLAATTPLLRNSLSSVLYAEVMVKWNRSPKETLDWLLCGHVPTLSTILGLCPIDYWTNTLPVSVSDEELHNVVNNMGGMARSGQMYLRTRWKRPVPLVSSSQNEENCIAGLPRIRLEAEELADILYDIYLCMFRDEDYTLKFANISLESIQRSSLSWYHRASFATIVQFFRTRVDCDWDKTMTVLMNLVLNRPNAPMGMNYLQELFVYLHIFGAYSNETLLNWDQSREMTSPFHSGFLYNIVSRITPIDEKWDDLRDWKGIPPVVCLTLKVPRSELGVFTQANREHRGTPPVHCILQDSLAGLAGGWHNIFSACHLAFGEVRTTGERYTDSFEVHIEAASGGWDGSASLIVSFYVPAFILLLNPEKAEVIFGVSSTPATTMVFFQDLGLELSVYKTTLANSNNVFITRHSSGQTSFPNPPRFTQPKQASIEGSNVGAVDVSLTAHTYTQRRIASMTTQFQIKSNNYKSALKNNCKVRAKMVSAFQVAITLGQEPLVTIGYPVVVEEKSLRTKVTQEPDAIEVRVLAKVGTGFEWEQYPGCMYPVHLQKGNPVNWNMTYLELQKCPIVDVSQPKKLTWLNLHLAGAMSQRERQMRENTALPKSNGQKTRLDFKESVFSTFVQFAGIQGTRTRFFGLDNRGNGGIHVVIIASSLRIDLATRAVVLDCAVLPLHEEIIHKLANFLDPLLSQGLCQIQVDDAELQLWKHVLPACVERCRQWVHKDGCEYAAAGQVPLAVENGEKFMCTCGNGKFPDGFLRGVPSWELAAKYAVRAAISPPFWAPFVEEMHFPDMSRGTGTCAACGKAKSKKGKELLVCARCKKQKYCSRECQRANWAAHKGECK